MSTCSTGCPFAQPSPEMVTEAPPKGDQQSGKKAKWPKVVLIVLVFNLVAAAAGTATGTVLSGSVAATVNVAVSQALQVQKPQFNGVPANRSKLSSTSADGMGFTAAVQTFNGEAIQIVVPVVNHGQADVVVEMTIARPIDCTPVDQATPCTDSMLLSAAGSGLVSEVAAMTPNMWKFTVPKNSQGTNGVPVDALLINVNVAGDAVPGYRNIQGQMVAVAY